jgi:SWI/SNF-related matrix-associated actin-dependent regulator of chromatin subfamily A3
MGVPLTSLFCSYQHVFSGAKRPRQEEAKGGIIADEMGLGKSLVILSTIASSLDRADDFMAAENRLLSTQLLRKAHSRATLILAPSSRRGSFTAFYFHLKICNFN